jgi:phosphoserine phosphatase RsbU/P
MPRNAGDPSMSLRAKTFWLRITDGIAIQQLWSQLHSEARASYRLYSKDVDVARGESERRGRHWWRVTKGLFWAMALKLSPARRLLFVIALILLVFPSDIDIHYRDFEIDIPNLSLFGAILIFILLALELADRVTMKRDLEIAKEIQTWLMPSAPPQVPGIEIAFATRPANTVAGDYYDAFLRSNENLLIIVADVAGKSVPAALLMATLQASLHTLSAVCKTPLELIERLNAYCCRQNVGGQRFTTAFLAELDTTTRQLTYINAGHNYPLLRRASGGIERLETGGVPLGLVSNAPYSSAQVTLASGDTLIIFTDGLVEAVNDDQEEYGEERMLNTPSISRNANATAVLRSLMASADRFVGTAPQHDDITCLVLTVL